MKAYKNSSSVLIPSKINQNRLWISKLSLKEYLNESTEISHNRIQELLDENIKGLYRCDETKHDKIYNEISTELGSTTVLEIIDSKKFEREYNFVQYGLQELCVQVDLPNNSPRKNAMKDNEEISMKSHNLHINKILRQDTRV